jgi:hypothetical protein
MTDVLPDCMMPDGAEPCAGYRQAAKIQRAHIIDALRKLAEGDFLEYPDGSCVPIADGHAILLAYADWLEKNDAT